MWKRHRIAGLALVCACCALASAQSMDVRVDARELPRKLLHAKMEIPAPSEQLTLWYPKWIPGIHAPRGPIENVAGLRFSTQDGKRLDWRRDALEPFRIVVDVPPGAGKVIAELDYICNQPSTNSNGVDSFGNSLCGIINWNTCLLYPDGVAAEDLTVNLSLRLPAGWQHGSALKTMASEGDWLRFAPASLETVIDSPLIAGEHFRRIPLGDIDGAPVSMLLTSESAGALRLEEELIEKYERLVAEAGALFGGAPFDAYALLVVCSDDFPSMGLEHLRSSLNGIGERDFFDEAAMGDWVGGLLPHELVHAWCGKYRRPAAMATPDYHTAKETQLLWVYEGLTTYLGDLLCARSGIWSAERFTDSLAYTIGTYRLVTGRQWRSLEDTAADSYHLRGRSTSWSRMRRGQDYYSEGLLFWMECDAIIRRATDGERSLDDFCRAFMGPGLPKVDKLPYTREDLAALLSDLAEHDWDAFIEERILRPQAEMPLTLVNALGQRMRYDSEPTDYVTEREKERDYVVARESLGIAVGADGVIASDMVPGMPADEAGMAPGMKVMGVNNREFSTKRFKDALADSVTERKIEFLVLDGDVFKTYIVSYADGVKYLHLERDPEEPDILGDIIAPLTEP